MFTFERRVGRLCELRVSGVLRPEDMVGFRTRAATVMMAAAGKVVFATDLRTLALLAPPVFDQLVTMLRTDNPKIERNGLLVGTNPTTALQMQRLVDEAGSPSRKIFRAPAPYLLWLEAVLTPEESRRLSEFIAEPGVL